MSEFVEPSALTFKLEPTRDPGGPVSPVTNTRCTKLFIKPGEILPCMNWQYGTRMSKSVLCSSALH